MSSNRRNLHGSEGSSGGGECYHCGKVGHKARQCPVGKHSGDHQQKNGFGRGGVGCGTGACYKCGVEGHKMEECPKKKCQRCGEEGHSMEACQKGKCYKCGVEGHKMEACAKRKCQRCGEEGHSVEACMKGRCYNCKDEGHKTEVCPKRKCQKCGEEGHSVEACMKGRCYSCKEEGHKTEVCPKRKCLRCGVEGHDMEACMKGRCYNCKEEGHKTEVCPKRKCIRCGEEGHSVDVCLKGKCYKCKEEGHKMEECPKGKCQNCGVEGHKMEACQVGKCYSCGQAGHKSRECTQKNKNTGPKRSPLTSRRSIERGKCYKCGGFGHRAEECPTGKCYKCGEEGHKAETCSKERKEHVTNVTNNYYVNFNLNIENLTMMLGLEREDSRHFLRFLGNDSLNEDYLEKFRKMTLENNLQLPSIRKMTRSTCMITYSGPHGRKWHGTGFLTTVPAFNGALLLSAGHNFEDDGFLLDDFANFNLIFNNISGVLKDDKSDPDIICKSLEEFRNSFQSSTVAIAYKGMQLIKKPNQSPIRKPHRNKDLDYFALVMNGKNALEKIKSQQLELLEAGSDEDLGRSGDPVFILGHPGLESCICCASPPSCSCKTVCSCRPRRCCHPSCSCRHPLRFSYAMSKKEKVEDRVKYDLDSMPGNSGSPITGGHYKVKGIHVSARQFAKKYCNEAQSLKGVFKDLHEEKLLDD